MTLSGCCSGSRTANNVIPIITSVKTEIRMDMHQFIEFPVSNKAPDTAMIDLNMTATNRGSWQSRIEIRNSTTATFI